jgi:hypothetical protein
VNDYVRYTICAVAGSVLSLAIFVSTRRSKEDVRRFVGMSLGGASAGAFAGMAMASLPDFADMPFSGWWMPVAFATFLAVVLPKALTDAFKMADRRKK